MRVCPKIFTILLFLIIGAKFSPNFAQMATNIGLKEHYATLKVGDTVSIPVFIAHYSNQPIDFIEVKFYYDTTIFQFVNFNKNLGIVKNWNLTLLSFTRRDTVGFQLNGQTAPISFIDGELVRLSMKVKSVPASGTNLPFKITKATCHSSGQPIVSITSSNGSVIHTINIPSLSADVNTSGDRNLLDADSLLKYCVGEVDLSKTTLNLTKPIADPSQNGTISSFDALLVSRHAVGLLPHLPIQPTDSLGYKRNSIEFQLSQPISRGNNIYEFTLNANTVSGIMAAEFSILFDTNQISNMSLKLIGQRSLSSKFNKNKGSISVAAVNNWPLEGFNISFLTITVQYKSGVSISNPSGFRFNRALLNEGRIALSEIKYPYGNSMWSSSEKPIFGDLHGYLKQVGQTKIDFQVKCPKNLFTIFAKRNSLQIHLAKDEFLYQIDILLLNGKIVQKCNLMEKNISSFTLPISLLSGTYIVRVESSKGIYSRLLERH